MNYSFVIKFKHSFSKRNIFLNKNQVKIGDFGVSKTVREGTSIGNEGTWLYMAPERIDGEKTVELSSDIWYLIEYEYILLFI